MFLISVLLIIYLNSVLLTLSIVIFDLRHELTTVTVLEAIVLAAIVLFPLGNTVVSLIVIINYIRNNHYQH